MAQERRVDLPTIDYEVDGIRFRSTILPFKRAKQLALRVARAMGPAAEDLQLRQIGAATILRALGGLPETDLTAIEDLLADVTRYSEDGGEKWPALDAAARERLFSGRLGRYGKWLWAALEAQTGDLESVLGGSNGDAQDEKAP